MRYLRRPAATVLAALLSAMVALQGAPAHAADTLSDGQWYVNYLRLKQAHAITQGRGVTIGVLDTGVDASHPDLKGSILPGRDFSDDNPHLDQEGHGTAMAALIVARGRTLGVAPQAKVLPIKYASFSDIPQAHYTTALEWAIEQRVKVLCIANGVRDSDPQLERTIKAALAADIVVVAAAGNRPDDKAVQYPAAYPGVIAAAAIDKTGEHADFSVNGTAVILAAPGVKISGPAPDNRYQMSSGTSNATAIIAGVAALVRAKYPQLSAEEVVHRMTATAVDKGPAGRDPFYGFGVVDPVAALTADVPPLAQPSPTPKSSYHIQTAPPESDSGFRLRPWHIFTLLCLLLTGAAVAVSVVLVRSRKRR